MLQETQRRLETFTPAFQRLVTVVAHNVQYPDEHAEWREDEVQDFKQARYTIAEALEDAAGKSTRPGVVLSLLCLHQLQCVNSHSLSSLSVSCNLDTAWASFDGIATTLQRVAASLLCRHPGSLSGYTLHCTAHGLEHHTHCACLACNSAFLMQESCC